MKFNKKGIIGILAGAAIAALGVASVVKHNRAVDEESEDYYEEDEDEAVEDGDESEEA